ncbi:hypothetical protein BKA82DRAFT_513907 [Pisolithus tinctorius]|uniref:Uncharacterized protein n=1 Tax=Pisolithus tinctorius Marx 270 TaxID=870435 RepID=A0A0C3PD17_PISTI|nr:hypothetical protein BKA82DRAFT_513907 [Pisolithus tinctorius]KIO05664.1 hypothetical protein M404DRAFT_513907 [Pisolithus tinctorius Marx 270]
MHGWRSDVIEKECLFAPRTNVESGDWDTAPSRGAESALIEARELALVTVKRAGQVRQSNDLSIVTLAIDVLDVLVRAARELAGGKSQRLLGAVVGLLHPLSMRPADAVQRLLSDLLNYHTKTHTVPAYILILLTALSSSACPNRSPRGPFLCHCMT